MNNSIIQTTRFWKAISIAALAVLASAFLGGCLAVRGAPAVTPVATSTVTPWPTLAPLGTAGPADQAVSSQQAGPQLVDKLRVRVEEGVLAVFPLAGDVDHPVRVEVIVLSGDIDPMIAISNVAGDQLASANRGGAGEPETIGQFQFPSTGYYELGIGTSLGQGDVGVSVYRLDPAQLEGGGVFASMDQELSGTMRQPASYHTFRLTVERGQRFDLSAAALAEGLDLLFELYGPDGALLEARDDNVGQDPYLWNFMPSQTGTYTVVLSNFDERVGDYVLRVSPSVSEGEAVIGKRTPIELSAEPRRSVWFSLEGLPPDGVLVDARPGTPGMDLTITMYDQYGNRLAAADLGEGDAREQLSFMQFPFQGSYQLEFFTKAEGGQMEYYIRPVRQVDMGLGGNVMPGGYVGKGEITGPGMALAYTFDALAGDLIGVDAHATGGPGLDLGFDLYTPDGYLMVTKDDDVGKDPVLDRVELPQSGRYVLLLWNYGGTIGPFELFVTRPGAPATPPAGDG